MKRYLMMMFLLKVLLISHCGSTNDVKLPATSFNDESSLECFKQIKIPEGLKIYSTSKSGNRGIPNATNFFRVDDNQYNIKGFSKDLDYGYTLNKPIFTGGHFQTGSARQWLFLSRLRDHNDRPVYFERIGSAGYYKDPEGKTSGIVDAYGIKIVGLDDPIIVFISLYAPTDTPIQIPKCFNYTTE